MLDLKDKWVVVTGAGRGIGRLSALKLIESGANLILVSRDKSHTEDIEMLAVKEGLKAVSIGCDLGVKEEVEALIEELLTYDIDVVLNNAGIQVTYRSGVWDTPWEDYEKSFRVNTIAPMMICYALLPKMKEKGFGRIVNTTSGIDRDPYQGPYSASKAALDKVTKDLEVTLSGEDILIFLADPGWCRTDLGGPNAPNSPESAVNGCIAGAFASKGVNGMIIHAQDYADMSLEEAVKAIENS
ncbi:MAG: SDR family oxidoreductase [Saccharofermentans sp.]|nr:SDR family oxidoreductase [Saccharofermentans sp.]